MVEFHPDDNTSMRIEEVEIPGVYSVRGQGGGYTSEYIANEIRQRAQATANPLGSARAAVPTDGEQPGEQPGPGDDLGGTPGDAMMHAGFEAAGWQFWTSANTAGNASRTTDRTHSGDYAMAVRHPRGSHYGMGATYDPVSAGDANSALREMYSQYWVYFPTTFDSGSVWAKLPGQADVEGTSGGRGGSPSNGNNGWSARIAYWRGNDSNPNTLELSTYTYHMGQSGRYGDFLGRRVISEGQWHRIDQYVKLNTAPGGNANADGALGVWVDGRQMVSRDRMRWTNRPQRGIDFWVDFYIGGSDPSPKNQSIYSDDYRIGNRDFAGVRS